MTKIGTDIIDVARIKEAITSNKEQFLNRVYTQEEIKYCDKNKEIDYQHFAARFAAKEAVFKALSSLIDDKYTISWKNIQIINEPSGRPIVELIDLSKEDEKILKKIKNIDISLSHLKEYAIATAVVEI